MSGMTGSQSSIGVWRRFKRWFTSLLWPVRLFLAFWTFNTGLFIAGNCIGIVIGDPFTVEAKAFQDRWGFVAIFLGMPFGGAVMVLSLAMLGMSFSKRAS